MSRAKSRVPSWMELVTLRIGAFGLQRGWRKRPDSPPFWRGGAMFHPAAYRSARRVGPLVLHQRLAPRGGVEVLSVVMAEVAAWEVSVGPVGFVDDEDVGLDALVVDQPVQNFGRSIGGVCRQPGGPEIIMLAHALDHGVGRRYLGLPHRRGRLDIDDDRVVLSGLFGSRGES